MLEVFEMFPTIVTPYTPQGQIDYPALGRLIDLFAQCHCDGLFAVCQSSEMFYLSDQEKLDLAAFCIERCRQRGMRCVVSGHTQDDLADQIAYLQRLEALRPDALILVSNRLAAPQEDDTALLTRLGTILAALRPDTRLGIYECPHPYKRLLAPAVLRYIADSGRFDFIKDTCCDIELIRERIAQLAGSSARLYNANAATLVDSFVAGAAGFSGVMLNMIPEVFTQLKAFLSKQPLQAGASARYSLRTAGVIGQFISAASAFEYQNYPTNAKYLLMRRGLFATCTTRTGKPALSPAQCAELDALPNLASRLIAPYTPAPNRELLFSALPPFENCHASTVLALADGTVLAAYFAGTAEGDADVGIWLSRRVEGVWQAPRCIAKSDPTPHWNPVLFETATGVRLVYKVGINVPTWVSRTMLSTDGGLTWSAAQPYAAPNEAGGPVRSKPLRMSNGLLLAPNSDETAQAWRPRVDLSADEGASFTVLAYVPLNSSAPDQSDYIAGKGAIQPTLWESTPGHIHMLLRTTCGYIFRSDSTDYGRSWCTAYNTGLPNNNSGIEIAHAGDTLYLVLNPISGNWGSRNPLALYRSCDGGRSFHPYLTLADQPYDAYHGRDAEFSYPAAVVADGRLHITYTYMRRQIAYTCIEL